MPANSASQPEDSGLGPQHAIRSEKPPAEPRLSIVHLMVATVCIAFYAGLMRVSINRPRESGSANQVMIAAMDSVGEGLALAGLLLVLARRRRGLPFPRHPGEYLVVVMGAQGVLALLWGAIFLLGDALDRQPWAMIQAFYLVRTVTLAPVYIYSIAAVKVRRWRVFFACGLVVLVLRIGVGYEVFFPPTVSQFLPFAPDAVLVIVVTMDLAQRRTYPWTHWLGVVTKLWLQAVFLFWLIWFWLYFEPPG